MIDERKQFRKVKFEGINASIGWGHVWKAGPVFGRKKKTQETAKNITAGDRVRFEEVQNQQLERKNEKQKSTERNMGTI